MSIKGHGKGSMFYQGQKPKSHISRCKSIFYCCKSIFQGLLGLIVISLPVAYAHSFSLDILITDHQKVPVGHAKVLFGPEKGVPFSNNLLISQNDGTLSPPLGWWRQNTSLPITIDSTDHILATYITDSQRESFYVTDLDHKELIPIKGQVTGYRSLRDFDEKVDFSLVLSSLKRSHLLHFDISRLWSPENDVLKFPLRVKLKVPSNLSLPNQKESYGIFTLNFNKPSYRHFTHQHGPQKVLALHGRFPLKTIIDGYREKKSFLKLINHFKFLGGGSLDVDVQGALMNQNISTDQWKLRAKHSVHAPHYGDNLTMFTFSIQEADRGHFFPMDVKWVASGQAQDLRFLKSTAKPQYVLSILMGKDEKKNTKRPLILDQISLNFDEAKPQNRPIFLNMIPPPQLHISDSTLTLNPPTVVKDVAPLGTYVALSAVNPNSVKSTDHSDSSDCSNSDLNEKFNHEFIEYDLHNYEKLMMMNNDMMDDNDNHTDSSTTLCFGLSTQNLKNNLKSSPPLWEIFNDGWVSEIKLPKIPFQKFSGQGKKYKWTVIYLGGPQVPEDRSWTLNDVSHITRNSIEVEM